MLGPRLGGGHRVDDVKEVADLMKRPQRGIRLRRVETIPPHWRA